MIQGRPSFSYFSHSKSSWPTWLPVALVQRIERGHIRIKSVDPRDAPVIQPNYLSTAEDHQVAVDSLRLTRRIAQAPALARYAPDEFLPGPQVQSDAELVHAAGNIGTTIFHPIGTCKMGRPDDPMAVVDSRLRIVDASIMPTITGVSWNASAFRSFHRSKRRFGGQVVNDAAGASRGRGAFKTNPWSVVMESVNTASRPISSSNGGHHGICSGRRHRPQRQVGRR